MSADVDEALDLLETACRETGGNGWFMGRLGKHPAMLELLRRAASARAARAGSDALRAALEELVKAYRLAAADYHGLEVDLGHHPHGGWEDCDGTLCRSHAQYLSAALAPSPAAPELSEVEREEPGTVVGDLCLNCGRQMDEHGGYGDPDYPSWRRECPDPTPHEHTFPWAQDDKGFPYRRDCACGAAWEGVG